MFTKKAEAVEDRCRRWPCQAVVGALAVTIIAVTVILVLFNPKEGGPTGRVVVTFTNREDTAAAQARRPLAGTEIVKRYGQSMVLSTGGGVSRSEVRLYYGRAVRVEEDPLVGYKAALDYQTATRGLTSPPRNETEVAVIDAAGAHDFVTPLPAQLGAWCGGIGSRHAARAAEVAGPPVLAVRGLGACGEGFASDIGDAIVWAAGGGDQVSNSTRAQKAEATRVLLLTGTRRGNCPSHLQEAVSRAVGLGALVVASAGDGGADHFPSNCAGVFSVAEPGSRAMAHVTAEAPGVAGFGAAWVAGLAAGLWTRNATAASVRAHLSRAATGLGWGRCEPCAEGTGGACGYDCLTCGIPRAPAKRRAGTAE
jgi:hypothetical protein